MHLASLALLFMVALPPDPNAPLAGKVAEVLVGVGVCHGDNGSQVMAGISDPVAGLESSPDRRVRAQEDG